jgi:cold shock CspA family protein
LRAFENEGRSYFRGLTYRKEYLGRLLRGETSNIEEQSKQYVQYTLTVSHFNRTQGFGRRINEDINYDIFVEVGRHKDVEDLLNALATGAGVPAVQAFGA